VAAVVGACVIVVGVIVGVVVIASSTHVAGAAAATTTAMLVSRRPRYRSGGVLWSLEVVELQLLGLQELTGDLHVLSEIVRLERLGNLVHAAP